MPIDDPFWPRADQWLRPAPTAEGADIAVIGVPNSAASLSPSAAHLAPAAIRAALGRFSSFDGESGADLRSLDAVDCGDWAVEHLDMHEAPKAIEQSMSTTYLGPMMVFLGGDNAITRPLLKGAGLAWRETCALLTLDAHHDVRILDNGPTNGSPVRGLIEDGLDGRRVAQVGISAFTNSHAYRDYCQQHGVAVHTMVDVDERGVANVVRSALDKLAEHAEVIYVDVDMDVLDSAYAPACPGARPGGMTPRQLFAAVRECGRHPRVGLVDFVEVDPTRDVGDRTIMATAAAFLALCSGVASRETA